MKKTVLLLALAAVNVHAADWAGLFGGGNAQQQAPQQRSFSWSDLLGQGLQQQQPQQAGNEQRPGFFESIKNMMNVMNDPEVKAKSEELKALIESKVRAASSAPVANKPAAQAQGGFDWSSLFGGSSTQQRAPQEQSQEGGFAGVLKKLLENAQQQPAQ